MSNNLGDSPPPSPPSTSTLLSPPPPRLPPPSCSLPPPSPPRLWFRVPPPHSPTLCPPPFLLQEHLPQEQLQSGLKLGHLFKGKLRLNMHNKKEGYVSIAGLPHDVLIRGEMSQNRALPLDEVVIHILPVEEWFKVYHLMEGGAEEAKQAGAVARRQAPKKWVSGWGQEGARCCDVMC